MLRLRQTRAVGWFLYPNQEAATGRSYGAAAWPLESWWRELAPHQITFLTFCPNCARTTGAGNYQTTLDLRLDANTPEM